MKILHTPVRPASRSALLVAGLAVVWAFVVGAMGPQPVPVAAAQAQADTISPPPPPSAPAPPVRASPAPEVPPVPDVPPNPEVPPVPDVRPVSPVAPVEPPPAPAQQEPRCRPGGQEAQEDAISGEFEGVMTRGSNWAFRRTRDGFTLCMRTHGDVTFADEGVRIESLGPDAWVVLASEGEGAERRVEIFPAEGALRHGWFVNGAKRPFDDEAREWLDVMLAVLGADARQARVAALRGLIAQVEATAGELERRAEAFRHEGAAEPAEARLLEILNRMR